VDWTDSPDKRGYWSTFRHADIEQIMNDPQTFSSKREGVMPVFEDEMAAIAKAAMGVGENVLTIDPPRHTETRKLMAPPFMPKALDVVKQRAREILAKIFDALSESGEIDRVRDFAVDIRMSIICDMWQVPEED
jgi:cytochrome P450